MKICFLADANSIHTRRWVEYFCNNPEYEVFILSTTRNPNPINGATIYDLATGIAITASSKVLPVSRWEVSLARCLKHCVKSTAFGKLAIHQINNTKLGREFRMLWRVFLLTKKASVAIRNIQPDLVHCLRLPIEGYIGGLVGYRPLAVSTWGNDLVYNACKFYLLQWLTRRVFSITDLYFPDNTRDKYIAEIFGYSPVSPSLVIPVTGGLKLENFPLYHKDISIRQQLGLDMHANVIISSRGFGNFYVNTQALVLAIPQILKVFPNSIFIMDGDTSSLTYEHLQRLATRLKVKPFCHFTKLSRPELLNYFAASDIMVSVTLYDGWPISLLEGMAYGLIPVMSNHSPIQEWITEGWNGYLFDPRDPNSIANAVIADYWKNMKVAEEMYRRVVGEQ